MKQYLSKEEKAFEAASTFLDRIVKNESNCWLIKKKRLDSPVQKRRFYLYQKAKARRLFLGIEATYADPVYNSCGNFECVNIHHINVKDGEINESYGNVARRD